MSELVIFPKSWLSNIVQEPYLQAPVKAAQNSFPGWEEIEIRNLWADLESAISAYEANNPTLSIRGEPRTIYKAFQEMIYTNKLLSNKPEEMLPSVRERWQLSQIPWENFLTAWINKLKSTRKLKLIGTAYEHIMAAYEEDEVQSTKELTILPYRRLLSVILLNAASKNDIIQARDIFWKLSHLQSPADFKKMQDEFFNKKISMQNSERRKGQKTYEADEIITNEAVRLLEEEDRKNPSLKRIDKVRNIVEPIREFIRKEFAKDTKLLKRLPTLLDAKNIEGRIIRFYNDKK